MAKDISKVILKIEDETSWLNLIELSEQRVVGENKLNCYLYVLK